MGLFDDDDELNDLIEESNKFEPVDLNEREVQALFNRCLASTKDSPNARGVKLFRKVNRIRGGFFCCCI